MLYSFENIYAAWCVFRRGKTGRPDVIAYEHKLEANLLALLASLQNNTYKHADYTPFTIHDPKQRQIHKATVQDRIVHQFLASALEPLCEPRFIYDSFSCRRGKGTHGATRRLRIHLRSASRNNTRKVYALKCDIQQFFASVDQAVLSGLIQRHTSDPALLSLTQTIIRSYATDYEKGMPLGNVTSQLFANIYLHELDWFVKQQLGERYYIRYCDDFIILSTSRQHLVDLVLVLARFLDINLGLTLHPHKIILRSWEQGIDFVGYIHKPKCTLLRTKTKRRMLTHVNQQNISSYKGICSHANAHQLSQLLEIIA